jgi:hypothetical protein
MKRRRFETELELGHKGVSAIIVPFDPGDIWGTRAVSIPHPRYRTGHLVKGAINGIAFEGWIGFRWGRFFIIVDEELQRAAGASPGDMVKVAIEPRAPPRDTRAR